MKYRDFWKYADQSSQQEAEPKKIGTWDYLTNYADDDFAIGLGNTLGNVADMTERFFRPEGMTPQDWAGQQPEILKNFLTGSRSLSQDLQEGRDTPELEDNSIPYHLRNVIRSIPETAGTMIAGSAIGGPIGSLAGKVGSAALGKVAPWMLSSNKARSTLFDLQKLYQSNGAFGKTARALTPASAEMVGAMELSSLLEANSEYQGNINEYIAGAKRNGTYVPGQTELEAEDKTKDSLYENFGWISALNYPTFRIFYNGGKFAPGLLPMAKRIAGGGLVEGIEETGQEIINLLSLDKPPDKTRLRDSFTAGGLMGTGFHAVGEVSNYSENKKQSQFEEALRKFGKEYSEQIGRVKTQDDGQTVYDDSLYGNFREEVKDALGNQNVYLGENGGAEGKYWIRNPNMNVSTEGMRPESLNALDMLGKYFYDYTGKPLILNAGTNGDHADGEFSHANGWKFDIIDQLDGDGTLITADYGRGEFLDQFIKYGRSLGLGMNFEGEGTSNVHLDVAVDGTQWDGNGDHAGGFNPQNARPSEATAQGNAYDPNFTDRQNEIWQAAQYASQRAKEKFGYDISPELIYKQWGHEAGANFDSENARYNNNFGGLTQTEPNGEENKQPDGNNYYRHFNNVREYADAYVDDFIKYYPEISGTKNEREFASVLKSYGYFGDTVENYVAGMEGIQAPQAGYGGSTNSNPAVPQWQQYLKDHLNKPSRLISNPAGGNPPKDEPPKPLFDLNSDDSMTQSLLEQFLNERADRAIADNNVQEAEFISGLFDDKSVFQNTLENRQAILNRYGEELGNFVKANTPSETQTESQQETPETKGKAKQEKPYDRNAAIIQAGRKHLDELLKKADETSKTTAWKLNGAIQNNDVATVENILKQNNIAIPEPAQAQPAQDAVNENSSPENVLSRPDKKTSEQEKLIKRASAPVKTGKNGKAARQRQGNALAELATQNGISIPQAEVIALSKGSTAAVQKWRDNLMKAGVFNAQPQPKSTTGQPQNRDAGQSQTAEGESEEVYLGDGIWQFRPKGWKPPEPTLKERLNQFLAKARETEKLNREREKEADLANEDEDTNITIPVQSSLFDSDETDERNQAEDDRLLQQEDEEGRWQQEVANDFENDFTNELADNQIEDEIHSEVGTEIAQNKTNRVTRTTSTQADDRVQQAQEQSRQKATAQSQQAGEQAQLSLGQAQAQSVQREQQRQVQAIQSVLGVSPDDKQTLGLITTALQKPAEAIKKLQLQGRALWNLLSRPQIRYSVESPGKIDGFKRALESGYKKAIVKAQEILSSLKSPASRGFEPTERIPKSPEQIEQEQRQRTQSKQMRRSEVENRINRRQEEEDFADELQFEDEMIESKISRAEDLEDLFGQEEPQQQEENAIDRRQEEDDLNDELQFEDEMQETRISLAEDDEIAQNYLDEALAEPSEDPKARVKQGQAILKLLKSSELQIANEKIDKLAGLKKGLKNGYTKAIRRAQNIIDDSLKGDQSLYDNARRQEETRRSQQPQEQPQPQVQEQPQPQEQPQIQARQQETSQSLAQPQQQAQSQIPTEVIAGNPELAWLAQPFGTIPKKETTSEEQSQETPPQQTQEQPRPQDNEQTPQQPVIQETTPENVPEQPQTQAQEPAKQEQPLREKMETQEKMQQSLVAPEKSPDVKIYKTSSKGMTIANAMDDIFLAPVGTELGIPHESDSGIHTFSISDNGYGFKVITDNAVRGARPALLNRKNIKKFFGNAHEIRIAFPEGYEQPPRPKKTTKHPKKWHDLHAAYKTATHPLIGKHLDKQFDLAASKEDSLERRDAIEKIKMYEKRLPTDEHLDKIEAALKRNSELEQEETQEAPTHPTQLAESEPAKKKEVEEPVIEGIADKRKPQQEPQPQSREQAPKQQEQLPAEPQPQTQEQPQEVEPLEPEEALRQAGIKKPAYKGRFVAGVTKGEQIAPEYSGKWFAFINNDIRDSDGYPRHGESYWRHHRSNSGILDKISGKIDKVLELYGGKRWDAITNNDTFVFDGRKSAEGFARALNRYFGNVDTSAQESTPPSSQETAEQSNPARQKKQTKIPKRSKRAAALHAKFKTDTHPFLRDYIDKLLARAASKEKSDDRTAALNEIKGYESREITDEMLDRAEATLKEEEKVKKREKEADEERAREKTAKEARRAENGNFISKEETDIDKIKRAFRNKVDQMVDLSKYPEFEFFVDSHITRELERMDEFNEREPGSYTTKDVITSLGDWLYMLGESLHKYNKSILAADWLVAKYRYEIVEKDNKPFADLPVETQRLLRQVTDMLDYKSSDGEAILQKVRELLSDAQAEQNSSPESKQTPKQEEKPETPKTETSKPETTETQQKETNENKAPEPASKTPDKKAVEDKKIIDDAKEEAYKILEADKFPSVKGWLDYQVDKAIQNKKFTTAENLAEKIVSTVKSLKDSPQFARAVLASRISDWLAEQGVDRLNGALDLGKRASEKNKKGDELFYQLVREVKDGAKTLEEAYAEFDRFFSGGKKKAQKKSSEETKTTSKPKETAKSEPKPEKSEPTQQEHTAEEWGEWRKEQDLAADLTDKNLEVTDTLKDKFYKKFPNIKEALDLILDLANSKLAYSRRGNLRAGARKALADWIRFAANRKLEGKAISSDDVLISAAARMLELWKTKNIYDKGKRASQKSTKINEKANEIFTAYNNKKISAQEAYQQIGKLLYPQYFTGSNQNTASKLSLRGNGDTTIANFIAPEDLTPQQKLIQSFGEKLGVKTVFFRNEDGDFHGAYAGNISYINVNSNMPLGKVFWHESMHWLKASNPKLYQQLVKAAGITDEQRQTYLKDSKRKDLETNAAIDEEIIADQFEDVAKRNGLLQSIAGKNRGLVERVVQWLKDTMNKFIEFFHNPQGKLTTKQKQALTDEFGRIASQLVDPNGERIFRYNRRTGNLETIGGRSMTKTTPLSEAGEIEYSVGNSNNSSESLTQKIRNAFSSWWKDGAKKNRNREITDLLYRVTGYKVDFGNVKDADKTIIDDVHKVIRAKHAYEWDKLLPQIGGKIAKSLKLNPTEEMSNYIADWCMTGAVGNQSAEAKAFEKAMRNDPVTAGLMLQIRDVFQEFNDMTAEQKIGDTLVSRLQGKAPKEIAKELWSEKEEQISDDLHPVLRQINDMIAKAEKTSPSLAKMMKEDIDPYKAMRLLRGIGGLGDLMIHADAKNIEDVRDQFRAIYPRLKFDRLNSLDAIIQMAGGEKHIDGLMKYAVAKLDKEMHEKLRNDPDADIRPQFSEAVDDDVIKAGEKQYAAAHRALVTYSNILACIQHDSGLISGNQLAKMLKGWKNYVPMIRVFEEGEDFKFEDSLKHKTGSQRSTYTPLETLQQHTYDVLSRAERNKAKQQLAFYARIGEFGDIIQEVETSNPGNNVINYREDGKIKYLKVFDPAVKRAVDNIYSPADTSWIMKFLRATMSFMRNMRTMASVDFAIGNPFRDMQDAYIHNRHADANPLKALLDVFREGFKGFGFKRMFREKSLVPHDTDWVEFQALGGTQSTFVSEDVDQLRRSTNRLYRKPMSERFNPFKSGITGAFKNVLDTMQWLSEQTEYMTRLNSYKRAKAELAKQRPDGKATLEDKRLAALEARDASIDFAKSGSSTRKVNQQLMFANAQVQDWAKWGVIGRDLAKGGEARKVALQKVGRLMLQGVVTTLAVAALNYSDDDRKEKYKKRPDWEKETYWIFGDGLRIPKGQDVATRFVSALTDEFIDKAMDDDPVSTKRLLKVIRDAVPSIIPSLIEPAYEVRMNYSAFRDAPIVPVGQQRLAVEEQYGKYTSSFAKLFSEMTGLTSPRGVDYLINNYLGTTGRFVTRIPDFLTRGMTLNDALMLRRFVFDPAENTKTVKDYYEAYDEQYKHYNTYKLRRKWDKNAKPHEDFDPKLFSRLKAAQDPLQNISKKENEILRNPKLDWDTKNKKLRELEERREKICEKVMRQAR